jgi:hypothetical protein
MLERPRAFVPPLATTSHNCRLRLSYMVNNIDGEANDDFQLCDLIQLGVKNRYSSALSIPYTSRGRRRRSH